MRMSSWLTPVQEIAPVTLFVFEERILVFLDSANKFVQFPRCYSCLFLTMLSPLSMHINSVQKSVPIAIFLVLAR